MASVTEYLKRKLKLAVNEAKSAVDRPWKRAFLGFTFTKRRPNRRKTSEKAMRHFKEEIRRMTQRTRGVTLRQVIKDLRSYLIGWRLYFGFSEAKSVFKELDSWVRRRLRCYLWKQWGRAGYRRLVERGVTRDLAWYTAKSAHGPWRISRSPALSFALPKKYFVRLGLPLLYERSLNILPNRRIRDPYVRWWCAMSATLARNYGKRWGRPPEVGVQAQASNHRKLRR